jgi:hypothetical protein
MIPAATSSAIEISFWGDSSGSIVCGGSYDCSDGERNQFDATGAISSILVAERQGSRRYFKGDGGDRDPGGGGDFDEGK